jgi:hypothetical protein
MTTTATSPSTAADNPRPAFRIVIALVGTYLALSMLTIVTAIVFRADPAIVNAAVWIRGSIVAVTAALMLRFAIGAASGNPRHYLRLRLVSAIMVVAIAAILLLLSSDFPLWMKIEQATCGVILLAVVILINGKRIRAQFASRPVAEPERSA